LNGAVVLSFGQRDYLQLFSAVFPRYIGLTLSVNELSSDAWIEKQFASRLQSGATGSESAFPASYEVRIKGWCDDMRERFAALSKYEKLPEEFIVDSPDYSIVEADLDVNVDRYFALISPCNSATASNFFCWSGYDPDFETLLSADHDVNKAQPVIQHWLAGNSSVDFFNIPQSITLASLLQSKWMAFRFCHVQWEAFPNLYCIIGDDLEDTFNRISACPNLNVKVLKDITQLSQNLEFGTVECVQVDLSVLQKWVSTERDYS
jgi:hypothetical protein